MAATDKIIPQSGVIPYRFQGDRLEVLLVTSSDGQRWVFPKGMLEPDLTPAESAAKEGWEEAGVRGPVVSDVLGTYTYTKMGRARRVEVFLLRVEEVLDQWPEPYRTREWVTVPEALGRVAEPELRRILRGVPELVAEIALEG